MTVKEFVDAYVKIAYHENEGAYGYTPFDVHLESSGRPGFNKPLSPDCGILRIYQLLNITIKLANPAILYAAVDFPADNDMKNDFVVIFSLINDGLDYFAIPYDSETGEIYPEITLNDSKHLRDIFGQFKHFVC